jgi:hypothetical protein
VIRTLELSSKPLSLEQIRQSCEQFLGRPVNRSTVKDCVHKHARGDNALFLRTQRGRYVSVRLR